MLDKTLEAILSNIPLSAEISCTTFRVGSGVHGPEVGWEDCRDIEPWKPEGRSIPAISRYCLPVIPLCFSHGLFP